MNHTSILQEIAKEVEKEPDVNKAREMIENQINQSKINVKDANIIREAINSAYSKQELLKKFWNLILAYQGLRVAK